MKNTIVYILIVFGVHHMIAQVGINKPNPTKALDMIGDVIVDDKVFLESPGGNAIIRGSKLLIHDSTKGILQYDIDVSKYGPINYAEYKFTGLSADGLQDYDTKISTTDYILTVQGYFFLGAVTGSTGIIVQSTIDIDNIEGYQFYAYPNTITGTWFLRGFVNNSKFQQKVAGVFTDSQIDLFLNVVIYRNKFIAKSQASTMSIDMSNSSTGTAPLPAGF